MATWNSRGLRGSTLEDLVNRTNEQYREKELALIQKIPTPITPVRMDKENRHITLAYFEQRSTVDYIGAVQGIPSFSYSTATGTNSTTSPCATSSSSGPECKKAAAKAFEEKNSIRNTISIKKVDSWFHILMGFRWT